MKLWFYCYKCYKLLASGISKIPCHVQTDDCFENINFTAAFNKIIIDDDIFFFVNYCYMLQTWLSNLSKLTLKENKVVARDLNFNRSCIIDLN